MISSAANQRVKRIAQLNKKASQRRKEQVFVAEGIKMFLEAPDEYLQEVYISKSLFEELERAGESPAALEKAGSGKCPADREAGSGNRMILDKIKKNSYEVVTDEVFEKMSDTQTPQGILSVVGQRHFTLEQILAKGKRKSGGNAHFLILENLQDPGNLGTIMRTGEGAGVAGIIMSRDTVDIYNPKTIRATMGSVYRVPFLYIENMAETVSIMKESGITVYAAHLKGEKSYDMCDYTAAAAFLIGNEGNGLTESTAALADTYIRIPMQGQLESLNAAVAAALLMYEAARQRRNREKGMVKEV